MMKSERRLQAACLALLLVAGPFLADEVLSDEVLSDEVLADEAVEETSDRRACPAMEQLRPLLNSERIKRCFGSYGVEVIEQQGNLRISSLYSHAAEETESGGEHGSLLHADDTAPAGGSHAADTPANHRITRTLAISEFADGLPDSLQEAYAAIRAGASMGATLENSGWRVDKRHRWLGEVPASTNVLCMSGQPADQPPPQLAAQVYDLWVKRDHEEVRFALLAELHDPRYLTLQDLRQIYPDQAGGLQFADETVQRMLQHAAGFCAQRSIVAMPQKRVDQPTFRKTFPTVLTNS